MEDTETRFSSRVSFVRPLEHRADFVPAVSGNAERGGNGVE